MAYEDDDTDQDQPGVADQQQSDDGWVPYVEPQPPQQYAAADTGIQTDASPAPPQSSITDWAEQPAAAAPSSITDWAEQPPAAAAPAADDDKWQPYVEPQAESGPKTALREAAHSALPGAVGFGAGALASMGTGMLLGSEVPIVGNIIGGVAGLGAYWLSRKAQDTGLNIAGYGDDPQMTANEQAHSNWALLGDVGASLPFVLPGVARTAAGAVAPMTHAIGGVLGGAFAGGQEYLQTGTVTPSNVATGAVLGSTLVKPGPLMGATESLAGRMAGRTPAAAPTPAAPIPGTPPADIPEAAPPAQGQMAFGQDPYAGGYDARGTPQPPTTPSPAERQGGITPEAQAPIPPSRGGIGGGEAQPELPFGQPPEPGRAGPSTQPEIPFEPPTINAEGQYGMNITAPVPRNMVRTEGQGIIARDPMPDAGGVAKESTPPPKGDQPLNSPRYAKEPDPYPHSAVGRGFAADASGVRSDTGINVMQPGQVEPTLGHVVNKGAGAAGPTPAAAGQEEPTVAGQALNRDFPRAPGIRPEPLTQRPPTPPPLGQSDSTQGVLPEPPVPRGMTRIYQGDNQARAPNAFTTDRAAAGANPRFVDVPPGQRAMFQPGRDPGSLTSRAGDWFRGRMQPIEPMRTEPVGQRTPVAEPARPSTPEEDAKIGVATGQTAEPAARQRAAAAAAKPADKVTSIPLKTTEPRKIDTRLRVLDQGTLRDTLAQHPDNKGTMGELTDFIRKQVADRVGDVPVYLVPHSELARVKMQKTAGYFNPNENHIVIPDKTLNAPYMAHTILHEGIHAATTYAINEVPGLKATINAVRLEVRRVNPASRNIYGLSDPHEFITEAFSDPKFQEVLGKHMLSPATAAKVSRQVGSPVRSAWDGIVGVVRKALGLEPRYTSALEAAMRLTEQATDLNDLARQSVFSRRGIQPNMDLQTARIPRDFAENVRPTPPKKPQVVTHDGGSFTGATVPEAAARAAAAGYRPHQIFNTDGTPYTAPKAGAAAPPRGPTPPAGAAPPTGAAPPAGKGATVKSTLAPAMKSDLQTGVLASLRRNLGGLVMRGSESAQKAQTALRNAIGPLARLKEQTLHRFTNEMHRLGNSMTGPAFEKFVDAYENGRVATLPKDQQELGNVFAKNYGDFLKEINNRPGVEQIEGVKNYLTHMYDNSNGQVDKFVSDWYGGGGGSLKQRTHPTFADARAADLQPLSHNPIEHFTRYSEGISHYLAQRNMMADLENQHVIGYFGPKVIGASGAPEPQVIREPPEGYSKIDMPWAQKNGRQAYAPRDIAETINQFYNRGLQRAQTKDLYNFLQQTKNMWTAVELGFSGYHALTVGVESMASGQARALQLAGSGRYAEAAAQLLKTPAEPITSYLYGRTGRQIYRDTTGTVGDPTARKIIGYFAKANIQPGNLKLTGEYDMSRLGNFWDASKRGSLMNEFQAQLKSVSDSYGLKLPAVLLENVRRAVQTLSKPLFEHYIPELKLGTMMKDMEAWMGSNPNATEEQSVAYAQRIADSVDNRMGEMNYDNMFINKTAKNLGTLALRSFGFTVGGPFREIGAGAGRLGLTAAQGKNPLSHLDLRSGAADPRTAYALAYLPTIAAIGAVYQLLRTGKGPEDWRDLITPQTGGTVKSVGKMVPERMEPPGYQKDFLGYFVKPYVDPEATPLDELKAKMAAPWTALWEQLTGKDWRNQKYVPPRATALESLKAHAQQLGSHMLPIGPKQLAEGRKPGSQLTIPEQMLGVRTPGAYMLNPKGLEQFLSQKQQRDYAADRKRQGLPPRPLPPAPR